MLNFCSNIYLKHFLSVVKSYSKKISTEIFSCLHSLAKIDC